MLVLAGAASVAACSDEDNIVLSSPLEPAPTAPGPNDDGNEGASPPTTPATDDPPPTPGPVYALQYRVETDDSVTSYVVLTDTLDVTELSLERAREFSGYAFVTASNGQLLVSDGESPIITRYQITPELDWVEVDRLSFANTGVTGGAAGFERHWFLNERTAYLTLDITKRVVWDPSELSIRGVMEDSALELTRDGLRLDATFNRQPRALQGPVLKAFYYRDEDWFLFGPTTPIAVYDPDTHEETRIIDAPCPALEVATQDEAGNTYFSGWTYGPTLSLFGAGPAPCVRRITPEATLDEEWTPDLRAWTGDRPVHVFRYMRDGKALGTVLHVDEVEIDFAAGYDERAAAELDAHWRLWLFDLEAESAREVRGLGATESGFNWANFETRTFVLLPYDGWARTKVFEIDAEGNATERFDTVGNVSEWLRVR